MYKTKKFHNISIDQFFKSSDVSKYETFMRWLKPYNLIDDKSSDLDELTYAEVSRLRGLLNDMSIENILEIYELLYNIEPKRLLKCGVLQLFQTNRYILKWVKMINDRENAININISEAQKIKYIAAGGQRLNQFKEVGTMINLGKMFGQSPEEIGDWKYHTVYLTLLYNSISMDVDRKMEEIK